MINHYDQLKVELKAVTTLLKINIPTLADYCINTGGLAQQLGERFGYISDDFIQACYWSNIGMISTPQINFEEAKPEQSYIDYYRKHVIRGEDFFREKGFDVIAEIVRNHHERPDGRGYLRAMSYPVESNFIRIADEFMALTRPSFSRGGQAYDVKEAARIVTSVPYENLPEFQADGAKLIRDFLMRWR